MEQLTVARLIKILQALEPDKLVFSEGCDCIGEAVGVFADGNIVVISREYATRSSNEGLITDAP